MRPAGLLDPPRGRYFWPNKLGRGFLLGLEDVAGRSGVNALLSQAKLRHFVNNYPPCTLELGWSFDDMSALNQAMEEMHGTQAGRALALRAGRAMVYHIAQDLGAVHGLTHLGIRVLPLGTRLRVGLNALADMFNRTSDQVVRIEETESRFFFLVDRCPICWGRSAPEPICHAGVGLLEEGLRWITGGRKLRVEETECFAMGAASCRYEVDRQPTG